MKTSSAPPRELMRARHYHQPAGTHPNSRQVERGLEWVELVTGGRGWVESGGRWEEVTAGALIWHVAGDTSIAKSDWSDPYRCLSAIFRVGRGKAVRRVPHLTWWPNLEELRDFVDEIVRRNVEDGFDREALFAYAYGRLLYQARVWQKGGKSEELPSGLRRAMEIIDAKFSENLSLAQVAAAADWSVAHLHDVFRARLGVTPHQAILQRRMQRARELLAATDLPIKRIASDCGFAGSAAFCQAFRARVGVTPSDFRSREARQLQT